MNTSLAMVVTKKKTAQSGVSPTAKAVAEAMAENMAKNQQDPNFETDKAARESKAADKALRRHGLHSGKERKESGQPG